MRLELAWKNWSLHASAKKGDRDRTSSCAANSRWSLPTTSVMIELVSFGDALPYCQYMTHATGGS